MADLVDADWYREQYPDVATADPLQHYMTEGWRQARDPGPLFDTDWFLASYPSARGDAAGPLHHFLDEGSRRLLRPHPLFDPQWYAASYPSAEGWDPFTHYVREGRRVGHLPSAAVADVLSAGGYEISADPPGERPRTVVVIQTAEDFMHTDRCLRALLGMTGWDTAIVLTSDGRHDLWQRWRMDPRVRFVGQDGVDVADDVDFLLLLQSDTEPLPGLLDRLVDRHRTHGSGRDGAVIVCPQTRATLVAPGIRSDWWRLRELRLKPRAALVSREDWSALTGSLTNRAEPADLLRRVVTAAQTVVSDPDSWVLSHLPGAVARDVQQDIPSWDPHDSPGLVLLTAGADHPVATAAMRAWLQVAACDIPAAIDDLRRWRSLLGSVPAETHTSLPRLVRRRDQLVDEIIQECLLQPTATRSAAAAIAARNRDAAVGNLSRHPDSYPAAVAVIALSPRSRTAPSATAPAPETDTPQIPRVIVQGWFDSPLPEDAVRLIRTWSTRHPGWQHRVFDTESAAAWLRDHLGAAATRTFRGATPVGKANLFRYAYLSVSGGVWADIDDGCRRSLPPLLAGFSLVVTRESIGAVADNFIAVAPGHPVLGATREEAFRNVADGFGESPWLANGPGLFTRMVAAWVAGLRDGEVRGYRLVPGAELSEYVAMHEHLDYKETDLAWDVPEVTVRVESGWGQALSPRQRGLREDTLSVHTTREPTA